MSWNAVCHTYRNSQVIVESGMLEVNQGTPEDVKAYLSRHYEEDFGALINWNTESGWVRYVVGDTSYTDCFEIVCMS